MDKAGTLVALALALVACSPTARDASSPPVAAQAGVHPVSGLPVISLTVRSGDATHPLRVELARTAEEQTRGLMYRTALAADEGMIFPMEPPRSASFWMRNTPLSLDIIFIAPDGRISSIAADTVPYSEAPIVSVGPVKAVLELKAGRARELGIAPGDRIEW